MSKRAHLFDLASLPTQTIILPPIPKFCLTLPLPRLQPRSLLLLTKLMTFWRLMLLRNCHTTLKPLQRNIRMTKRRNNVGMYKYMSFLPILRRRRSKSRESRQSWRRAGNAGKSRASRTITSTRRKALRPQGRKSYGNSLRAKLTLAPNLHSILPKTVSLAKPTKKCSSPTLDSMSLPKSGILLV